MRLIAMAALCPGAVERGALLALLPGSAGRGRAPLLLLLAMPEWEGKRES